MDNSKHLPPRSMVKTNLLQTVSGILVLCTFAILSSSVARALDFAPLCYSESGGSVRNVSNCALLSAALSSANPGDIIILANGEYNCSQVLSRSGTAAKPIIIRAATARAAKFVNASLTLGGNYIVVANLTFDDSGINVTGDNNRVTANKFQNQGGVLRAAVTVDRGDGNRIDHNEVVDYFAAHRGFRILPATSGNNTAKNNVIDRNYLHRSLGPVQNGADGIQLGANSGHTLEQLNSIVEYNLIEQWEVDSEMISNKSSDNIIRFNTFANSKANAPMRHGARVSIISNYFLNVRGLINYGDDNKIIGNIVENAGLIIRNGNILQTDIPNGASGHPASRRTLVAANTVINGELCVGCRVPGGDAVGGLPATYTDLRGNNAKVTLLDHNNTTQNSSYNGIVAPAVKLLPHQVGPGSPDVCTSNNGVPGSPSLLKIQ